MIFIIIFIVILVFIFILILIFIFILYIYCYIKIKISPLPLPLNNLNLNLSPFSHSSHSPINTLQCLSNLSLQIPAKLDKVRPPTTPQRRRPFQCFDRSGETGMAQKRLAGEGGGPGFGLGEEGMRLDGFEGTWTVS